MSISIYSIGSNSHAQLMLQHTDDVHLPTLVTHSAIPPLHPHDSNHQDVQPDDINVELSTGGTHTSVIVTIYHHQIYDDGHSDHDVVTHSHADSNTNNSTSHHPAVT